MRLPPIAAGLLLLGACGPGDRSGQGHDGPIRTDERARDNALNAVEDDSPVEAGDLPRASEGLRFIGRWAAGDGSCESASWQFTETTLRTPAGAACSFNRVTEVPGGYDIQATCTAEGPPASDALKLRFAESAKAMLFESQTIANSSLAFCGREV